MTQIKGGTYEIKGEGHDMVIVDTESGWVELEYISDEGDYFEGTTPDMRDARISKKEVINA